MRVCLSPRLLLIDEMGDIPFEPMEAPVFIHLISKRYDRGAPIILTSNRSYGDWGTVFGDSVIAAAILDRLLHRSVAVNIVGRATGCAKSGKPASCPAKRR